jgi:hypothetical protein
MADKFYEGKNTKFTFVRQIKHPGEAIGLHSGWLYLLNWFKLKVV